KSFSKAICYGKTSGLSIVDLASYHNNIGLAYFDRGDMEKALEHYENALSIDLKILGQYHLHTGTTILNIGLVKNFKKDYSEANDHLLQSLKIYLQTFGEEHLWTANVYSHLGTVQVN